MSPIELSWTAKKGRIEQGYGRKKVVVVKIVFHAEGGRGVNAGERGLSMLWSAKNVVKMWQRILERQDEMRTREDENTLRNCWQKTRTTLSFGCTLSITTKAVRMSTIQWRW